MAELNLCLVVGTRPEIIKLAPVISELKSRGIEFTLVNAGQHYDYLLTKKIFSDLNLDTTSINLNIGSSSHAQQTASALLLLENIISNRTFDAVVAQGDTNTVLASALAASKQNIPFVHVEAGLRSFDRTMPEEINRKVADHIASVLFAPTDISASNLLNEGISKDRIFTVGNTVVDALNKISTAMTSNYIKEKFMHNNFALLTLHRSENTDSMNKFELLLNSLMKITHPVIFPIHPRTKDKLISFGLWDKLLAIPNLKITEPLGYADFLNALKHAQVVLTDSGGIQEEACVLKVPCITLRNNTERPESVAVGGNVIVGLNATKIAEITNRIFDDMNFRASMVPKINPFGDGTSSKKIVDTLIRLKAEGRLNYGN